MIGSIGCTRTGAACAAAAPCARSDAAADPRPAVAADRPLNEGAALAVASDGDVKLLKLDGRPIGTTRLDDLGDGRGVIRLVAIAADVQRRGHGSALSLLVEDYARALGMTTLLVNADPEAVGYYEKMGWTACTWDEAELTGIAADCKQMTKPLLRKS